MSTEQAVMQALTYSLEDFDLDAIWLSEAIWMIDSFMDEEEAQDILDMAMEEDS